MWRIFAKSGHTGRSRLAPQCEQNLTVISYFCPSRVIQSTKGPTFGTLVRRKSNLVTGERSKSRGHGGHRARLPF